MRILRVADIANNRTGGMSRAMYNSGDSMVAAGHEVEYLFEDCLGELPLAKLRRFILPARLPYLIAELHKQHPYDLVEIHEPLTAGYCLSRKIGLQLPPLVLFSHGLEQRFHQTRMAYQLSRGLKVSLKERYSPLSVVLQAMYGLRHCNQIMCLNSQDEEALKAAGIADAKINRINLGVDNAFLQAGREIATQPRRDILFVGNWLTRKGIWDLATAATLVLKQQPKVNLTIAGCTVSTEEVLQSFPSDLWPRIQVIPRLSNDKQLIEVYRQHGIFVLPSYMEGQPLVMLEAAAMSLALVATDTAGMRDFIEHGRNGLLVPVSNAEKLASSLNHLVVHPDEARRLGEVARQKVQRYTWENTARDILVAYKKAISTSQLAQLTVKV